MKPRDPFSDRLPPLVALIGRTGAKDYRIEYTDEANGPVVWVAVVTFKQHGSSRPAIVCAADVDPTRATYELAAKLVDGGTCRHCRRLSAVERLDAPIGEDPVLADALCWYQWDPELRTYRRSCEGDTPPPRAAR